MAEGGKGYGCVWIVAAVLILGVIGLIMDACEFKPLYEPATDSDGVVVIDFDLSEKKPYRDLAEGLVEQTRLGPADVVYTDEASGAVFYYWLENGSFRRISFAAKCEKGNAERSHVVKTRENFGNYSAGVSEWPRPTTSTHPNDSQQTAPTSPSAPSSGSYSGDAPNPHDYDSPEEYADNEGYWFYDTGHEDPWQSAYEYWEDNQ